MNTDAKVLVTGSLGFVGKNLVCALQNNGFTNILEYDKDTAPALLDDFTKDCTFVFHLAGVNRPQNEREFLEGNADFTYLLLESLKRHNNKAPVLMTSSIQAALDNPYGRSKKAGEDYIFAYGTDQSVKTLVYRLPNVFGKWCRPNYNSAVATFCNNIANDLPITINDPEVTMSLVYIDDVVAEFINALNGCPQQDEAYCYVKPIHTVKLGEIVDLLRSFKQMRNDLFLPNLSDAFTKKLYSTYLSYLPEDQFSYPLKMHTDDRGSFTEFIKTPDRGQVSINVSKPGITKGNHYHHTKNEKFLVVSGHGVIQFRKIGSEKMLEYDVSGDKPEVVDIPVGYTHNIINLGTTDMVTVMWANEAYDSSAPDTYFLEVSPQCDIN